MGDGLVELGEEKNCWLDRDRKPRQAGRSTAAAWAKKRWMEDMSIEGTIIVHQWTIGGGKAATGTMMLVEEQERT